MSNYGKKALYTTPSSVGNNLLEGLTTHNRDETTDPFRLATMAQWTNAKLEKGSTFFENENENGLFDLVEISNKGPRPDLGIGYEEERVVVTLPNIPGQFEIEFEQEQGVAEDKLDELVQGWIDQGEKLLSPEDRGKLLRQIRREGAFDNMSFHRIMRGKTTPNTANTLTEDIWQEIAGYPLGTVPIFQLDRWFTDSTFVANRPLNEREVEAYGSSTRPLDIKIESDYVFQCAAYEKATAPSSRLETLMPNMYAYLSTDYAKGSGLMPLLDFEHVNAYSYENPYQEDITPFYSGLTKTDEITAKQNKNYFDKYVDMADAMLLVENQRIYSEKQRNIAITPKNYKFIKDYNDRSKLFPMWTRIEMLTDNGSVFGEMMREAGLTKTLLKNAIFSYETTNWETETLGGKVPFSKEMYIKADNVNALDLAGNPLTPSIDVGPTPLQVQDFDDWFSEFTNSGLGGVIDVETVLAASSFVGDGEQVEMDYTNPTYSFYHTMLSIMLSGKMNKILESKKRNFLDVMNGKPAYSEILFYRVSKHRVNDSGEPFTIPIQNFWVSNSDEISKLVYYDTQVKYGEEYQYLVTAYTLIVGTEYQYSNYDPFNHTTYWRAQVDVITRPVLKLIEVPLYGFTEDEKKDARVTPVDNPPPPPQVDFVPVGGSKK